MREPGSDGKLHVMFLKKFHIICSMTLLTKGEEGQTLKITIWELPGACTQKSFHAYHVKSRLLGEVTEFNAQSCPRLSQEW